MTRLERQDSDLSADFFERRMFFRVQRTKSVIAAFNINGWPHFFDQLRHAFFGKKNGIVYPLERRDEFKAVAFGIQRTAFTFEEPNRIVAVNRNGERIAEGTRSLKISNVSDVQQIKAPIRQNKLAS